MSEALIEKIEQCRDRRLKQWANGEIDYATIEDDLDYLEMLIQKYDPQPLAPLVPPFMLKLFVLGLLIGAIVRLVVT